MTPSMKAIRQIESNMSQRHYMTILGLANELNSLSTCLRSMCLSFVIKSWWTTDHQYAFSAQVKLPKPRRMGAIQKAIQGYCNLVVVYGPPHGPTAIKRHALMTGPTMYHNVSEFMGTKNLSKTLRLQREYYASIPDGESLFQDVKSLIKHLWGITIERASHRVPPS